MRKPQPFLFKGNTDIGVLLIHGFSGTTNELQGLGQYLHQQGWTVHAPLLKGHGQTSEEMERTTWVDWWVSAQEGYDQLVKEGCSTILVVGLSMGGLLALKIAQYQQVSGIVTLCAPVKVRDKRFGAVQYLQYVMPYKKRSGKKAEHIERELFIQDKVALKNMVSLHNLMNNVSRVIPGITQPILIIQSELDETVDPSSGDLLYQLVGSKEKEIVTFSNSTHIITLDHEKEQVFERVKQFIQDRLAKLNKRSELGV